MIVQRLTLLHVARPVACGPQCSHVDLPAGRELARGSILWT